MTVQKLKEAVKELTPQERILFVQYVLDTVAADTATTDDAPLSKIWIEELEMRSTSYGKGETTTQTWETIKKRLVNKYQ